jgi:hypothetical protein
LPATKSIFIYLFKIFIMKKIRLSLAVILAVAGGAAFAIVPAFKPITPGWYGQVTDSPTPYNTTYPISTSTVLNIKCPVNAPHLCAVLLKSDGTLDGNQSPNTRQSTHNYQP